MDPRQVKQQYLLSKWTPIIQECRASGMTVKSWCLENNVNEKQFFYWQRKVRMALYTSAQMPEKKQSTVFAPLQIQDYHQETSPSIKFRPDMLLNIGDYQLELSNQTSPELLETILKVIRHV